MLESQLKNCGNLRTSQEKLPLFNWAVSIPVLSVFQRFQYGRDATRFGVELMLITRQEQDVTSVNVKFRT